jgi:hypothetical protein
LWDDGFKDIVNIDVSSHSPDCAKVFRNPTKPPVFSYSDLEDDPEEYRNTAFHAM